MNKLILIHFIFFLTLAELSFSINRDIFSCTKLPSNLIRKKIKNIYLISHNTNLSWLRYYLIKTPNKETCYSSLKSIKRLKLHQKNLLDLSSQFSSMAKLNKKVIFKYRDRETKNTKVINIAPNSFRNISNYIKFLKSKKGKSLEIVSDESYYQSDNSREIGKYKDRNFVKSILKRKKHIFIVSSPKKSIQLSNYLESFLPRKCDINFYYLPAIRIKELTDQIKSSKCKHYFFDFIGYYKKETSVVRHIPWNNIHELPTEEQSKKYLYFYFLNLAFTSIDSIKPISTPKNFLFSIKQEKIRMESIF